jgi:hypothetical protein
VWDVFTGELLHTLSGHTGRVHAVALSLDGRLALTGSMDTTARVWDTATGRRLHTLTGHGAEVDSVALSADGRVALTGSADGTARIWDTATGRCLRTLPNSRRWVALSADARYATLSDDGRLWELDWDYDFPEYAGWDEGARPHLDAFLAHRAMSGPPHIGWNTNDFDNLLESLRDVGYGWLSPGGMKARERLKITQQLAAHHV